MAEKLSTYTVKLYRWDSDTSAWGLINDLTTDIVSTISMKWGIKNIEPSDRIADIGTCSFILKNIDNEYSPENAYTDGIVRGDRVIFRAQYDNDDTFFWCGYVEELKFDYPQGGLPTVEVGCVDFINKLSLFTLPLITIQYDKTIDEAASSMFTQMSFQGEAGHNARKIDVGTVTFPSIYDDAKKGATAFSELNKLVMSELGYLYLRHNNNKSFDYVVDTDGYEDVIIENANHRHNMAYTEYRLNITDSGLALYEGYATPESDHLLTEDEFFLMLDETTTSWVGDEVSDTEIDYGSNLITQFSVKYYPRLTDVLTGDPVVLFALDKSFPLLAGETKYIYFTFTDPRGGSGRVNGRNMVTPVSITDYQMDELEDGSGIDFTAFLTVDLVDINHRATGTFGSAGGVYKVTNIGLFDGWVIKLQARGYGVYFDNPYETLVSASTVIGKYGTVQQVFDQKYVATPTSGIEYAELLLGREMTPRKVLNNITFIANITPYSMGMFMYHDIGDMIHITLNEEGFSGTYFIHNIETTINMDGIIYVKWGLKEHETFTYDFFTLDDAALGLLDSTNVLGF